MKNTIKTLPLCAMLLASGAMAQEQTNGVDTNATPPASLGGLQLETRTDEERIGFLMNVAAVYFEEKDYTSAIDAYERILEIDPENKEVRYIVGHVYINAKQYPKAEAMLKSLIEENPEDFQLKNNLAWLYATAEDPAFRNGDKAVRLAQEAMAMAPNDHHVWSTLAEAYYVSGQYEKAHRAANHMAGLAARYGKNITKEMVEGYNEQIRKCKRAFDSEKALEGKEESTDEPVFDTTPNP